MKHSLILWDQIQIFKMTIWKRQKIGAYHDEDKCHMTDLWPIKWWKLAHHLMYTPAVH